MISKFYFQTSLLKNNEPTHRFSERHCSFSDYIFPTINDPVPSRGVKLFVWGMNRVALATIKSLSPLTLLDFIVGHKARSPYSLAGRAAPKAVKI